MNKDTSHIAAFVELNLIGKSPVFVRVLDIIKRISAYDVPVSIYGETGTGKELVARAIHYFSTRSDNPFIPVNCGSLPDALFENEMFGHERGAFTDANSAQTGLIDSANGGTLFLDEVEALSQKAQVSLLRFLQDKQYRPLGGSSLKTADVRIVVASNVGITQLIEEGKFREDLYFRLNIMPITLPPLRERNGDVMLLANHFLQLLRIRYDKPSVVFHPSFIEWMQLYEWPGNIRELENMLHRAFLLADEDTIELEYANPECIHEESSSHALENLNIFTDLPFSEAKAIAIKTFEVRYLKALLNKSGGNITQAAKIAGKERRTLGKLIHKHGLQHQI